MTNDEITRAFREHEGDMQLLRAQISALMLTSEICLGIIAAILPGPLGDAVIEQVGALGGDTGQFPRNLGDAEAVAASDMAVQTAESVLKIARNAQQRRSSIAATLARYRQPS